MTQLFFFGSLRDRELLEVVLGHAVADSDFRAAKAHDFATLSLENEAYPYLAPRDGAVAEGVLVSNLTTEDLDKLCYFEEAEYGLAPVDVETPDGTEPAQFFQATEKAVTNEAPWDFDAWTRDERAIAIEAAIELMAHRSIVAVEDVDAIWPGIMIRARMRARAKAEVPVTGNLRQAWTRQDVEVIERERSYTRYFAVEDLRLRHRRFDGTWSPEIARTAVTSGDAVTVLPFDPNTGAVALIEQFRAPVFARGDGCPWGVEVIAGRLDAELDPEICARREAREEAGLTLGRMERIAAYYASPGLAAEHITAFVAEADLSAQGGIFGIPDEAEDIRAFTTSLNDALDAVRSGEINNGPALLSLLWLESNAQRLRQTWLPKSRPT